MFWGFVRLGLWDTCMGTRHRWMSSFGNPRLVFLHLWKHYYTVILHTSVLENVVSVSSLFISGSFLAYQLLFPHMCLFWFFHLFSLCMCLCVECVPVCRPQLTVGIFLEYSPLYLIRQGELPGDPSPSPHTGVTGIHQACPPAAFSGGFWESRLQASWLHSKCFCHFLSAPLSAGGFVSGSIFWLLTFS